MRRARASWNSRKKRIREPAARLTDMDPVTSLMDMEHPEPEEIREPEETPEPAGIPGREEIQEPAGIPGREEIREPAGIPEPGEIPETMIRIPEAEPAGITPEQIPAKKSMISGL